MLKKTLSMITLSTIALTNLNADKVTLANDHLGDFLIAPLYIAKNEVCSNVKVFNTNETSSILAKVTFREQISSQEVDLPIFLSPGDVWEGTVCQREDEVILTSTDDSNHPKVMEILQAGKSLTEQSKSAGHTNIDFTKGYIEIYPIAQFNENSDSKVMKSVLVKRWDNLANNNMNIPKLKKDGVDGYSLSGLVSFQTQEQETASIPMTAFKGTHDKQVTGNAIAYSSDTSPEILLGQSKKNEILKLLQKKVVSFTYDNNGANQYVHLTFPFGYINNQTRKFKVTVRDMNERKNISQTIFSPSPIKNSLQNEVAVISIEELISQTNDPQMFSKGMIQIKEITNQNDIQLGYGKPASLIATSSRVANIDSQEVLLNILYVPTK